MIGKGIFDGGGVCVLLSRWEGSPSLARLVWKVFCFQVGWGTKGLSRRSEP
jgi:hypothetical protein